jgi:hypothetical protein
MTLQLHLKTFDLPSLEPFLGLSRFCAQTKKNISSYISDKIFSYGTKSSVRYTQKEAERLPQQEIGKAEVQHTN